MYMFFFLFHVITLLNLLTLIVRLYVHRLPDHVKEWFRAGVAALDLHFLPGSTKPRTEEAEKTDENTVTIFKFEHPMSVPDFEFKKDRTKHRIQVADIMQMNELATLLQESPSCRGAVVHISDGSPHEPFDSKQLKTMLRHICMFCQDYMTILVLVF